jgi:hypothetical protein
MISQNSPQKDVPASVAVAFLLALAGGWIYLKSPVTFAHIASELDRYSDTHWPFIMAVLFSVSVNAVWLYSILSRVFGINRHGKRLEILSKGQNGPKRRFEMPWVGLVGGILVASTLYTFKGSIERSLLPQFIPLFYRRLLALALSVNFGFSSFVVLSLLETIPGIKGLLFRRKMTLPEIPMPKNQVIIGADEGAEDRKKVWVPMNLRALNGNILVTGSIGSGKTSAVILMLLEQFITNFVIRPAMLIIDPKTTFIDKARALLVRLGLKDNVIHMRLGGEVTFNPIYREKALKGARFLEIAQMVKATAANFARTASDGSFWTLNSFNLIRSSITHCAAVLEYFTLRDLYTTLVRAGSEDLAAELKAAQNDKNFDEEEKANIEFAIEYFSREYSQLEPKVRTSILATATSFLNQFQEYQASRIFCPKKEELTVQSMDEVIENGKIFLFDIRNQALALSMGTFIKLHYEQALLDRLAQGEEKTKRPAVLIIDEYQDVVTVGGQGAIGDGGFLAKGREGNTITIAATQSISSLKNSIRNEDAAKELIQNFRTRIACHSSDVTTIKNFQEMTGQKDVARRSHSVSEQSHHAKRNIVVGGFEAKDANISESLSTTDHKEDVVTGKDFQSLSTFECFALIYDGIRTHFYKLCLKPYYLKAKNTPHWEVLKTLEEVAVVLMIVASQVGYSFPNVCSVAKTNEFKSCLNFSVGACMCGWPVPRPCAKIEYYVPQTFIEVMPDPKSSYFGFLPGTAIQLGTLGDKPYGQEADEDTHSYQAHVINVPLAEIPFSVLSCGGARIDKFCFDAMSEHLGMNWNTGTADSLQPQFLAWSLSPKACLLAGAAKSFVGGATGAPHPGSPVCSFPMDWMPKYPPSPHEACNGWGTFYPRVGTAHGPSNTMGALMVASRMKSLSSEVFNAAPASPDELWQMIYPQATSCFREGQNMGLLENANNVRELGRLTSGKLKGHLFVIWSKVSCCHDFAEVPYDYALIEAMSAACKGLESL